MIEGETEGICLIFIIWGSYKEFLFIKLCSRTYNGMLVLALAVARGLSVLLSFDRGSKGSEKAV